jgi:hypothetical protein
MNSEQKAALLQYLTAFLADPNITNEGVVEPCEKFDQRRVAAITQLKPLVQDFLSGKLTFQQFKEQHEFKCREFPYWGFKGFSGQMQLNQYVNNIARDDKEDVFKKAAKLPATEKEAHQKIVSLTQYIAAQRAASDKPQSLPRPASAKYVLSYLWEIQENGKWPVFYNSSMKVLEGVGLVPEGDGNAGDTYLNFLRLMQELQALFESDGKQGPIKYPYWFVEHVLWREFLSASTTTGVAVGKEKSPVATTKPVTKSTFAEIANEWLPPVVADLNDLALNQETPWSERNGVKPEKAFETKVRIAFTLLGYEATELGQGKGREPDGFAISVNVPDGDYAIVYDAKAREKHFSVGTTDREMYEYIKKKSEELRKLRVSRSYFLVVSSEFDLSAGNLNLVKDVFRRTRIPIVMVKASDLQFLIQQKLKDVDLTHERLETLLLETGVLTREKMVDILGIK